MENLYLVLYLYFHQCLSLQFDLYVICIQIYLWSQVEVGKGGFVRRVVRRVGEEEATPERVPVKGHQC